MPYKSAKQRKFMHAKHPEIAARWDAEYGGKVKKSAWEPELIEVRKRLVKVGEYVYHTTKNTLPRLNLEDVNKPRLARRAVTHVYDTKGKKVGHFTTSRDLWGEGKKTSQIHYASHLRPGSGIGEEALRQSMKTLKTKQFAHSQARTGAGDAFTRRTSKPETLKSPRPTGDASNLKRATGKEERVSRRAGMRARAFSYVDSDQDYLLSRSDHPFGRKSTPSFEGSRASRHVKTAATTGVIGGVAVTSTNDKKKKKRPVRKSMPDASAVHVPGGKLRPVKKKKRR